MSWRYHTALILLHLKGLMWIDITTILNCRLMHLNIKLNKLKPNSDTVLQWDYCNYAIRNFSSYPFIAKKKRTDEGIYTGGLCRYVDRLRPSDNFFSLSENMSHAWPLLPPGSQRIPPLPKRLVAIVTAAQQDVVTLRYRLHRSVCSCGPQAEPVEVNHAMHAASFPLDVVTQRFWQPDGVSFETVLSKASLALHFPLWQSVLFDNKSRVT